MNTGSYTLNLPAGVTATSDYKYTANSVGYFKAGASVSISTGDNKAFFTLPEGVSRSNGNYTVTINDDLDFSDSKLVGYRTNSDSNVSINAGNDDDLISLTGGENISVVTGNGNDTIKIDKGVKSVMIEDFSSSDEIQFDESVSVVNNGDNGFIATFVDGSQVSIGGMTVASQSSGAWHFDGNDASYGGFRSAGNQLSEDGKTIKFGDEQLTGSAQVELSGVEGNVSLEGTIVKLSSSNFAGNVSVVSNAGGYDFNLSGEFGNKTFTGTDKADSITNDGTGIIINGDKGDDLITNNAASDVTINTAQGNDTIKIGASVKSFSVDTFEAGDEIQFASAVSSLNYANDELIVTVGGGNDGKTIIINNTDILNADNTVTVSSDYVLDINDSIKSTPENLSWTQDTADKSKYVYVEASNTDGYKVVDNQIVYNTDTRKTFTLEGLQETLTTADNASLPEGVNVQDASLSDDKKTYTSKNANAWYYLQDTTLTYHPATTSKTFTLSGLNKSLTVVDDKVAGVTIDGKNVTVAKNALNGSDVTLTGEGFTLGVANDVPTVGNINAGWTGNNGTYTYNATAGKTAGYTLSGNTITYSDKVDDSFTLSGIANTKNIAVQGKIITIAAGSLNGSNVTLTSDDGYSLKLAKNVPIATESTTGYTLEGNTIIYSEKLGDASLATGNVIDKNNLAMSTGTPLQKTLNYSEDSGENIIADFTSNEYGNDIVNKDILKSGSTVDEVVLSDNAFIQNDNQPYWFENVDKDGTAELVTGTDSTTDKTLASIMTGNGYATDFVSYSGLNDLSHSQSVTYGIDSTTGESKTVSALKK